MALPLIQEQTRETGGAEAAFGHWIDAINVHDSGAICDLYHPDAVLLATLTPLPCTTPEALREYFDNLTALPELACRVEETHLRVHGDAAIVAGLYHFSFRGETGEPISFPARFCFTFGLSDDGWQILCHHSSRLVAPNS